MDGMKNIIDPLLKMDGLMGQKEKETVIIDENFSTSDINLGVEEENPALNIGNMLKAVDNSGLLGMISGEQSNSFGKLIDIVNKLKDTGLENRDAINDILKNDLGLDVDKINKEMVSLLSKDNLIEE
jgi:5'-3' exonuclease